MSWRGTLLPACLREGTCLAVFREDGHGRGRRVTRWRLSFVVYGGFEIRHGVCCVAQRCVRRWEPGVSKIGEYTGYCPRPQAMVLLLTGVTWCHMSLRLFFCSPKWLNMCYL